MTPLPGFSLAAHLSNNNDNSLLDEHWIHCASSTIGSAPPTALTTGRLPWAPSDHVYPACVLSTCHSEDILVMAPSEAAPAAVGRRQPAQARIFLTALDDSVACHHHDNAPPPPTGSRHVAPLGHDTHLNTITPPQHLCKTPTQKWDRYYQGSNAIVRSSSNPQGRT